MEMRKKVGLLSHTPRGLLSRAFHRCQTPHTCWQPASPEGAARRTVSAAAAAVLAVHAGLLLRLWGSCALQQSRAPTRMSR